MAFRFQFVRDAPVPLAIKRAIPKKEAGQQQNFAEIQSWEGSPVKAFEAALTIKTVMDDLGIKAPTAIKEDKRIVDYQDVSVVGYLSVFRGPENMDRDGEYVIPGAYKETLKRFRENAVFLKDHRNSTDTQIGSFTQVKEDKNGLFVVGLLSNSPDVKHQRFLVAEGHTKTLSIGGVLHYSEDGRGIFKVDLFEGSLVTVPADPDAKVQTRALGDEDWKALKSLSISDAKPTGVAA